jgi:hypothetical protein
MVGNLIKTTENNEIFLQVRKSERALRMRENNWDNRGRKTHIKKGIICIILEFS